MKTVLTRLRKSPKDSRSVKVSSRPCLPVTLATGDVTPIGHRGGQTKLLADSHRQWLLKTVLAEPDITLHDLQTKLMSKQSQAVSVPTLCRELRGLNLRRKKSLVAGERNARKRGWHWRRMKEVVHERLRFLYEAGATTVFTKVIWASAQAAPGRPKQCREIMEPRLRSSAPWEYRAFRQR